MLRDAPVVYDKQQEIRQLLIDEVRTRKTIRPEDFFTRNWKLVYPGSSSVGGGLPPAPAPSSR
jgi:2',3'-cyclic-nucleotide 2'-phosphodiesterase / 3'-nucleotidase